MSAVIARHEIRRERRDTRRRQLSVSSVERLTPVMQRIRLGGDLADFLSPAPDDHVKLFFPMGDEVVGRDFTPRAFDPVRGELTLDFALHQSGPASDWARAAKPGDRLEIGGPRGSVIVADDFDWYLLIGDETALPAITRRIEELRPGVPVTSFVVLDSLADAQQIETGAAWQPHWVTRQGRIEDDPTLLREAIASHALPSGDGYVWIAAEAAAARALRADLERRGHPKAWLKAAGYWVRGAAGASEKMSE